MDYQDCTDDSGQLYLKVALTDYALLQHSFLNKGTAFSKEEREALLLLGLLPPNQSTLQLQRLRSYQTYQSKSTDLEKYIYLRDLQNSNETLFYSLLLEHLPEMMPIVYTPVVGLGCQHYSHIYRRPRGIYISYPDRDHIDQILSNVRFDRVRVMVVSDGERILGLGDQGAGGMGISIGKLTLYTACAGIHPTATLPIFLDTGTDNPQLLNDPLYIGWHHARIRGKDYDDFVDAFVIAVKKRYPHVLLHWEDFSQNNAYPILKRYCHQLCSFNDDIQGTAAVVLGALLAAIHKTGSAFCDQRIVVFGAGSAGCGISSLIMQEMINAGLSEREAKSRFYLVDRVGLLTDDMTNLHFFQLPFAQSKNDIRTWHLETSGMVTLKDVIQNVHATVLIGTSSQAFAFTEEIVREMGAHVKHPIIFPLSNPTSLSEANPKDIYRWTHNKAIVGTGSPFGTIIREGKPYRVDQTNNVYLFPGLGLGLMAVQAREVSDNMLIVAAKALAEYCALYVKGNNILPELTQLRDVSLCIALAVAKEAVNSHLACFQPVETIEEYVRKLMWFPEYLPYKKW